MWTECPRCSGAGCHKCDDLGLIEEDVPADFELHEREPEDDSGLEDLDVS